LLVLLNLLQLNLAHAAVVELLLLVTPVVAAILALLLHLVTSGWLQKLAAVAWTQLYAVGCVLLLCVPPIPSRKQAVVLVCACCTTAVLQVVAVCWFYR
jgi:hypothetical protein